MFTITVIVTSHRWYNLCVSHYRTFKSPRGKVVSFWGSLHPPPPIPPALHPTELWYKGMEMEIDGVKSSMHVENKQTLHCCGQNDQNIWQILKVFNQFFCCWIAKPKTQPQPNPCWNHLLQRESAGTRKMIKWPPQSRTLCWHYAGDIFCFNCWKGLTYQIFTLEMHKSSRLTSSEKPFALFINLSRLNHVWKWGKLMFSDLQVLFLSNRQH